MLVEWRTVCARDAFSPKTGSLQRGSKGDPLRAQMWEERHSFPRSCYPVAASNSTSAPWRPAPRGRGRGGSRSWSAVTGNGGSWLPFTVVCSPPLDLPRSSLRTLETLRQMRGDSSCHGAAWVLFLRVLGFFPSEEVPGKGQGDILLLIPPSSLRAYRWAGHLLTPSRACSAPVAVGKPPTCPGTVPRTGHAGHERHP